MDDLLIAGEKPIPGGTTVTITVKNIKNQRSAKDAGGYTLTTLQKINGNYYRVDEASAETSFVATPGKIFEGAVEIDNPKNSAQDVTYSFKFKMEDEIPASGYVDIYAPPTVQFVPSTTMSVGDCRTYSCVIVETHYMRILIPSGLPGGSA